MSTLGDRIRSTLTPEMWEQRRRYLDNDAVWFDVEHMRRRVETTVLCHAVAEMADAHPEESTVYGLMLSGFIRRDVCNTVEMQLVACERWLPPEVKSKSTRAPRPPRRAAGRASR
jgi:hypothetical protein